MANLYLGGIPTAPDVKRLHDEFGVPNPGDEFTHQTIEFILGLKRNSSRYRTVTSAWRKELLTDKNIDLAAVPGEGYRCLDQSERVEANVKIQKQGIRRTGKGVKRLMLQPHDKLDQVLAARRDHAIKLGGAIFQSGQQMMRELSPPKAAQQTSQLGKPRP